MKHIKEQPNLPDQTESDTPLTDSMIQVEPGRDIAVVHEDDCRFIERKLRKDISELSQRLIDRPEARLTARRANESRNLSWH